MYFYDAHTYYQLDNEEALEAAKAFKELMQERFKSGSNFYYGPTHTKPVGPHYEGQFKIVFTRHNYTELVNWLVLHRPLGLSLLIHPHTLDAVSALLSVRLSFVMKSIQAPPHSWRIDHSSGCLCACKALECTMLPMKR